MDALDRLAPVAAELLDQVDAVLAQAGAPEHHPVWPLLRRLGALPGEAVSALAVATPGSLAAVGATLSDLADEYARLHAALPGAPDWQGAGADRFATQWQALSGYLDDDLADGLRRTASYVDEAGWWAADLRERTARTLATVLTSAEAVELRTAAGETTAVLAEAAAGIAVRVLEVLVDGYDRGERLLAEWAPRLSEVPYRAPTTAGPPRFDLTTEVQL